MIWLFNIFKRRNVDYGVNPDYVTPEEYDKKRKLEKLNVES